MTYVGVCLLLCVRANMHVCLSVCVGEIEIPGCCVCVCVCVCVYSVCVCVFIVCHGYEYEHVCVC